MAIRVVARSIWCDDNINNTIHTIGLLILCCCDPTCMAYFVCLFGAVVCTVGVGQLYVVDMVIVVVCRGCARACIPFRSTCICSVFCRILLHESSSYLQVFNICKAGQAGNYIPNRLRMSQVVDYSKLVNTDTQKLQQHHTSEPNFGCACCPLRSLLQGSWSKCLCGFEVFNGSTYNRQYSQ